MECAEAAGVLERFGGGLYIVGRGHGRAGIAVDTRLAPRTRVLAHGLGEGDELLMQGSRRRGRARGQEEKEPNAIKARSATVRPWAHGGLRR